MKKNSRYLDNSYISNKSNSRKSSSISNQNDYSSSAKKSNKNSKNYQKDNIIKEIKSKEKFLEDYNYQIESSSKNITDPQKTTLKTNNNYIEQLESKIQDQAKRLNELTKYKYLCEKRLKQLNPIEELPITEETLSRESLKISQQTNQKDKYDQLYEQYIILLKSHNDLINKNNNNIQSNENSNESNGNYDKYKKLKEKYKNLKQQHEKTIELLKEETLVTEEQRNMIALLKQTIDNDLIKNNLLKKYITSDEVIDFVKIKNEAEEYRKELVLSQALVNSLKSEIEIYMNEKNKVDDLKNDNYKKDNKKIISFHNPNDKNIKIENEDIYDNNNIYYNKIINENDIELQEERKQYLNENSNLKNKLSSQNKKINELIIENSNLKQLLGNSKNKLNEPFKGNKKEKNNNLQNQLNNTIKELSQYEEKFIYFNEYISNIKQSLDLVRNLIIKYIEIYNQIIKIDTNKILSENFIQNLKLLFSKVNNLSVIEQYNLDSIHDSEIHQLIEDLLKIIHDEFITIYDKVLDNNDNYNDINSKIYDLDNKLKINSNEIQEKQNEIISLNEELNKQIEENIKLKKSFGNRKIDYFNLNDNQIYKNKIQQYKKEKDNIIKLCNLIIQIHNIKDLKLGKLFNFGIKVCEELGKLNNEKESINQKINNLQEKENYDNNEIQMKLNQEYNTLLEILNEIERKIEENEKNFEEIKEELNNIYLRYNNNLGIFQHKKVQSLINSYPKNNYDTEKYQNIQNQNFDNTLQNSIEYFTNRSYNNLQYNILSNSSNKNRNININNVGIPRANSFNGNQLKKNNILQKSQSQKTYEYIKKIL